MTKNDFFIGDTLNINWDFVLTLPYFKEFETTQQNPRWHSEGNVLEHVKLTVENMQKFMVLMMCMTILVIQRHILELFFCAQIYLMVHL